MKKWLIISIVILFGFKTGVSQCLPDRHSSTWYDGWISCSIEKNPNLPRGETHFIMYDLGASYYLYDLHVWNMNAPDILDYGLKDVYIDLSLDGASFTELGQFTFQQATGENDFEGILEVDFEGNIARYILITPIDNYGGTCYGLSEVRIRARDICPDDMIAWIGEDGDWDVATNWCNNQIPTNNDNVWIPPNKNITVPSGYTAEALRLDVDRSSSIEIIGQLNVSDN